MQRVKRNYGIPEFIQNRGDEKLTDKLKKHYPYLLDAMDRENFKIEVEKFSIIKEIIFDEEVVGFSSFLMTGVTKLSLCEIYVLPEFRGNGLFIKDIHDFLISGSIVNIVKPNLRIIECLIKHGLAVNVNSNLVMSGVGFDMIGDDLKSDTGEVLNGIYPVSNLYDMDMASPVCVKGTPDDELKTIFYQDPSHGDETAVNDIDEHLMELRDILKGNSKEFSDILDEINYKMPLSILDYDEIIGDGDELTPYLKGNVDDGIMDYDTAVEIRDQLKREYENKEVTDEGLTTRMAYLLSDMGLTKDMDELEEAVFNGLKLCPSCLNTINSSDTFCEVCGYNIEDLDFIDYEEILKKVGYKDDEDYDDKTHFGKQLAKASGIDLKELQTSVKASNLENLEDKIRVDLSDYLNGKKAVYMKDELESFSFDEDKFKKHTIYKTQKSDSMVLKAYQVLTGFDEEPSLDSLLLDLDLYDDEENIKDFIFHNDYAQCRDFEGDLWEFLRDENDIEDLQWVLEENNLDTSGSKQELVDRIKENHLYDEINVFEFEVSERGRKYLKSIEWVEYYTLFLDRFSFPDFEKYVGENPNSTNIILGYLDEHEKLAYKRKDFFALHDVYAAKALYWASTQSIENALNNELKLFITKLNPIFVKSDDLLFYHPINYINIHNIKLLLEILNISNVKGVFDKNWNKMKFKKAIINKKSALKYLKKAFKTKDLEDLSEDIGEKYYY